MCAMLESLHEFINQIEVRRVVSCRVVSCRACSCPCVSGRSDSQ